MNFTDEAEDSGVLGELSDQGVEAKLLSVAELLKNISLFVEVQTSESDMRHMLKNIGEMLVRASKDNNIEKLMKVELLKLEKGIESSIAEKERLLSIQRAQREIKSIKNKKSMARTVKKIDILRKEKYAILKMRKELSLKETCSYLNRIYKNTLKDNLFKDFSPAELNNFIKRELI